MDDCSCFSWVESVFHLADGGAIRVAAKADVLGSDPARAELRRGALVSVFGYSVDWDYRERHPDGDELVVVLDGEIDLLLDRGDGERSVRAGSGQVAVIPAGAWHRVGVRAPATLLFVTPEPARTEHRSLGALSPGARAT